MKWFAITGSWKAVNDKVVHDVQEIVNSIIEDGNGIVTGGALGVDYIAAQVALEKGDVSNQIKIYLPIPLADFCKHYWKRADEGAITHRQAEMTSPFITTA